MTFQPSDTVGVVELQLPSAGIHCGTVRPLGPASARRLVPKAPGQAVAPSVATNIGPDQGGYRIPPAPHWGLARFGRL